MPRRARTDSEFEHVYWARVRKTNKGKGCWIWRGTLHSNGYGAVKRRGRIFSAHRMSWMLTRGPIPKGLFVLHLCDVPNCVNPAHLFLGTQKENMRDKTRKGRGKSPCGEGHYNSKVTWRIVRLIRAEHQKDRSYDRLAKRFQIHRQTVADIVRGKTWKPRFRPPRADPSDADHELRPMRITDESVCRMSPPCRFDLATKRTKNLKGL